MDHGRGDGRDQRQAGRASRLRLQLGARSEARRADGRYRLSGPAGGGRAGRGFRGGGGGGRGRGRCAGVVSRESDAKTLRLRLFKLKTRELDLSLDAAASVQAIDKLLPNKIDDFIAAVFDTHGQQILGDLKILEKWTDPKTPIANLLANAGVGGAEKLIAHLAGITPAH